MPEGGGSMRFFWIRIWILCLIRLGDAENEPKRVTIAVIVDAEHVGRGALGNAASQVPAQLEAAAQWAAQVVNNQTGPHHTKIDIRPLTSFSSPEEAMTLLEELIQKGNQTSPLIGAIGIGDPKLLGDVASALTTHDVVLMTASPRATETLLHDTNSSRYVVAAAPGVEAVARATVAVAKALRAKSLRLVGTCAQALQEASKTARRLSMNVADVQLLEGDALLASNNGVLQSLLELPDEDQVIAAFLEPHEMSRLISLLERHGSYQSEPSTWLLGCLGSVDKSAARDWSMNLGSTHFLIEPHMPQLEGFKEYSLKQGWKEDGKEFKQAPEVPYVVQAISTLGAALQLMDMNNCTQISFLHNNTVEQLTIPCVSPFDNMTLQRRILRELKKLSLPLSKSSEWGPRELNGVTRHISHSGKLSNNGHVVYRLSPGGDDVDPAAWYSDEEGLVLAAISHSANGRSFVFGHSHGGPALSAVPPFAMLDELSEIETIIESLSTQASKLTTGKGVIVPMQLEDERELIQIGDADSVRPMILRKQDTRRKSTFLPPIPNIIRKKDLITNQSTGRPAALLEDSPLVAARPVSEISMSRTWAAALVAVAVTVILGAVYILTFLSVKMHDGTLRGHQGFSIMLLFSIIGMCCTVSLYVLPPSENICALRVFLTPLAMSTCYSVLLVQLMHVNCQRLAFNIASSTRHVRTPSFPLYVTLILALAVQVAISSGWYSHQDPKYALVAEEAGCSATPEDLACLHIYPLVLLMIVAVYGVILRSKQEARWITAAALSSTPFLVVWGMICFLAPGSFVDVATSILFLVLSCVLLGTVFVPKVISLSHLPPKNVKMSPYPKKIENPMILNRTLPFGKRDPVILNIETLKPRAVANRYHPFSEITPRNAPYTLPRPATTAEPQTPKRAMSISPNRLSPYQEVPPPYRRQCPPADLSSSSTATFKSYRRTPAHSLGMKHL